MFGSLPPKIGDFDSVRSFNRTIKFVDFLSVKKCLLLFNVHVCVFYVCCVCLHVYVWAAVSAGYPALLFLLIYSC